MYVCVGSSETIREESEQKTESIHILYYDINQH
jgi:hypothetical protein